MDVCPHSSVISDRNDRHERPEPTELRRGSGAPGPAEQEMKPEQINHDRRRYLSATVKSIAAAELTTIGGAAQPETTQRKKMPAIRPGTNTSFASLRHIDAGVLNDWGARTANITAALWPERCKAMVSVSGYLIGSQEAGKIPLPPKAELQWWYQYYFATERGRAGYDKYRHDFAKLIWQIASPKWNFDDAMFDRSAASLDNPDHVGIAIHNYRWRLALAEGEPKYDDLERRLAAGPVITVPTITLEGDANGAPHPDASSYVKKILGKVFTPDHRGRHRTQSATGSAASFCPSCGRR